MGPELSHRLGRAMGKASPAPTLDEREAVIQAASTVETFEELPTEIQELVLKLESSADKPRYQLRHLPGKHDQSTHGHGGGKVDGVTSSGDYHMPHTAPDSSYGASMDDPEDMLPDILEHPEWYATGNRDVDQESMAAIRKAVEGGPDTPIKVYRAAPIAAETINPGDWVTPSRTYAEEHMVRSYDAGEGRILERTVQAKELHSAGDIAEWGWTPDEGRSTKG